MVKLKIDNYDVEVPAGTSILDAARTVQIEIPTLCKHPDVVRTIFHQSLASPDHLSEEFEQIISQIMIVA